jgi:hypothetical protein
MNYLRIRYKNNIPNWPDFDADKQPNKSLNMKVLANGHWFL